MSDVAMRLARLGADERRSIARAIRSRRVPLRRGPLSNGQRRLWFLERLDPGGRTYVETSAARLRSPIDPAILERALLEVVARHEILRTTFHLVDGEPEQRVWQAPRLDFLVLGPGEPAGEGRAAATATVAAALDGPFDLERGPLLRAAVLRLGPEDHVVGLSMHHIVCDGWSMGVLSREVAAIYAAFAAGRPSPLAPLALQYLDAVALAGERHAGAQGSARLAASLGYWQGRLDGLAPLPLPADRPAGRAAGGAPAGRVGIALPPAAVAGLDALCAREESTRFMAGLTAYLALLARWTGHGDLAVGCPVAGRGRVEVEELIGFFVNIVVVRVDWSGEPTFREALARVREAVLGAFEHQDVPFDRVVEAVAPPREAGTNPLFQTTFQMLATPPGAGIDDGAAIAKFPLRCDLWPSEDGGIAGALEYEPARFDRPTVEAMARGLEALVSAMARAPGRRVGEAPLLTAAGEARAVARAAGPAAARPDRGRLARRVRALAQAAPEALAVAEPDGALDYRGLDAAADALAHRLRAAGGGAGARVAVAAQRPAVRVAAALAAMRCGAAFVPLDPDMPASRLAAVLRDCRPVAAIHDRPALGRALRGAGPVAGILVAGALERGGPPFEAVEPPREAPAYIVYTSGSTGTPKGVEVPHGGLENLVEWHLETYGLGAADRCGLVANPGFDASVWEIWPALAAGASLHAPEPGTLVDPLRLGAWMAAEGITVAFLPTPVAELFVEAPVPGGLRLRALLTGGDRLRRHPRPGLPYRLFNHYGPSEASVLATMTEVAPVAGRAGLAPVATTIGMASATMIEVASATMAEVAPATMAEVAPGATMAEVAPGATMAEVAPGATMAEVAPGATMAEVAPGAPGVPPIGWPIANVEAHVLDPHGRPVPDGATGELHIGGAGVGLGYVGDPDLTRLRFVPDRLSGRRGGRLFRTGDRVRRGHDGCLHFLGRLDAQLKVRGQRVEPAEIETAIDAHPAVARSVVVADPDGGLAALVQPAAGAELGAAALRAHLRARLPAAMVPARIELVSDLPTTPRGKLDRGAASSLRGRSPQTPAASEPAADAVEAAVLAAWSDALGGRTIGRHDSFFDAGGHSLLLVAVHERLARTVGPGLSLVDLFANPTASQLARRIGTLRNEAGP